MFAYPSSEPSAPVRGDSGRVTVSESSRTLALVQERLGKGLATLMGNTLAEDLPEGMLALVARIEAASGRGG